MDEEEIEREAAMIASMTISPELNQSFSSPRSSRTCMAPIARLSVPKPNQSSFAVVFRAVSGRKVVMPRKARTPIGRLM